MPTIRTGNQEWDQNLNTLGSALFPDPSKAAHAYYYGTEARNALLKGAQTQESLAAGHRLTGMLSGDFRAPSYGPGPLGVTILQDPYAGGAPTAAPAPVNPNLAAAVAGGPGAVGDAIVAGIENHTQTGPVPPVQSPAPNAGAAPAPTTTGSNGSTPQNGPGSIAPGSVTSAGGGGVIRSGPAAANGSPAPINFDFARAMDMGAKSGLNADQMQVLARSTLANMEKNGQMATPQVEALAALFGAPTMRVQSLSNQGALAVGAQTQAGETARNTARIAGDLARQQLVTGEARRADEFAPEKTVDEAGNAIYVSRKDTPGKRAYDSTLANTVAGKQAEYGTFVDPTNPLKTIEMTRGRASALGMQPTPVSQDAVTALGTSAVMNAPPDQAAEMRARVQLAMPPAKPVDANETARKQFLIDQQLDKMMPVPSGMHPFLNTNSAAASPELGPVLTDLADQYFNNSTDKTIRNDPIASANAALKQLIRQGYVDPKQDRSIGYYPGGTTSYLQKPVFDKAGNIIGQTNRFKVDIINPKTKQPYSSSEIPARIPMEGAGAGATTTTKTPPISGTVLGPATGVPEGKTGTDKETGAKFIVRGGNYVVQ